MTIRKGFFVTYRANGHPLGRSVRAIVRSVHHGTATVEAIHELDEDGKPAGPYLGQTFQIDQSELSL